LTTVFNSIGRAHEHRNRALWRRFDPVPVIANAPARPLQHLVWPIPTSYGIWYARDKIVKAGAGVKMPKTLAT
jgi:hypothetical protein